MIHAFTRKFIQEIKRVASTAAFRYSLLFTLGISMLVGVAMVIIYQTAANEIVAQIDTRLNIDSSRLQKIIEYRATNSLHLYRPILGITERIANEPLMSFCVVNNQQFKNLLEKNKNQIIIESNFSDLCNLDINKSSQYNKLDRAMRIIIRPAGDEYALILGYNTRNEQIILKRMLNMVYLMTLFFLISSFLISFYTGRAIVNSIARISITARRIVDGDFSERIPTSRNDSEELCNLTKNLNHMLDRIEGLITSQRQVTNNIAHDLRSPLNRLRNRMEVALLDRNISCNELREVIAQSVKDAENLLGTFNALLNIAQIESRARDDFSCINISNICNDLAELYEVLSEEGDHNFESAIVPDLQVMGNRHLIAQAIINLLDNAVKYTPSGGKIELRCHCHEQQVIVSVIDNGKGIPGDKFNEVLKRFVRLDRARSTPGNGLGLSLVSAVTNLHNAMLLLKDNKPGLCIEIIFSAKIDINNAKQQ